MKTMHLLLSRIIKDSWITSFRTSFMYYTMAESLDGQGRPFVASFTGDELHGYDSIYYNESGFEERIFFTDLKISSFCKIINPDLDAYILIFLSNVK